MIQKLEPKGFDVSEVKKHQIVLGDTGCHGMRGYARREMHTHGVLPHYVVGRDGEVYQFGELLWTGKGVSSPGMRLRDLVGFRGLRKLNQGAVRIDLEAYGAKLPNVNYDKTVWYEYCPSCKYRGVQYWEMYTDKQLASLKDLLREVRKAMGIDFVIDPMLGDSRMCHGAIAGAKGVYFAGSYRGDAVGCHPQLELLKVIKTF